MNFPKNSGMYAITMEFDFFSPRGNNANRLHDICNIHVDDVIKREAVTLFLSTYRLFCRLYLITTELDAICPAGEYKQLCQSCIVQNLCWTFAMFQD